MKKVFISDHIKEEDVKKFASAELAIRESFLQASKELLDGFGIEEYSLEQIRGMLALLEKFNQLQK